MRIEENTPPRWLGAVTRGYDPDREVDLAGFAASLTAYAAAVAGLAAAGGLAGRRLPEGYATKDLLLGALAVHKFTRVISKSSIASPLRAPFTTFEEAPGSAEHTETPLLRCETQVARIAHRLSA